MHTPTGLPVAIKVYEKALLAKDLSTKRAVQMEISLMTTIKHKAFTELFDVVESPTHLLLVMEYAKGQTLLQTKKRLPVI